MLIWRIEDENGEGMYRGSRTIEEVDDMTSWSSSRHPCPHFDDGLGWNDIDCDERDAWKFGFATLGQMRQWVYKAKWRKGLDEIGFSLVCYRVPDKFGRRSNFQAIFHSEHAERVEVRQVSYADKRKAV